MDRIWKEWRRDKKTKLSTAVATNESPNAILESSVGDNVAQADVEVKKGAIALVDELVQVSSYYGEEPATHPHCDISK